MNTGNKLKKELGLEKLSNVKINRAVVSSYKVLFVWYDTYRSNMPITSRRIKTWPWVAHIFHGTDLYHNTKKATVFTPPMDIEDYNGSLRGALVIPVDLAGDRFIDATKLSKKFESIESNKKLYLNMHLNKGLLKEIDLYDLKDKDNISAFTMKWRKDRSRIMGQENTIAKLVDCYIDEAGKSVTFAFLTEATELKGKNPNDDIESSYKSYDGPKGEVDPDNFKIKNNRSKTYELQIKIIDFFDWLDVFEGESIGTKEMKEILQVSDVQLFSTSPSMHWQGFNYWLSQIDASIYPTNIAPTQWDKYHGDGQAFLDKHLYGLLRQIDFWLNPMSSMLTKKLKDRGLL